MKIVYLILSANLDFFKEMERIIEHTYLAGADFPYYFVTESETGTSYVEGHHMYCDVPTDVSASFRKMIIAFNLLKEVHPDYDVVVRPNTSTWVNVNGVKKFIESSTFRSDALYCGSANAIPAVRHSNDADVGFLPYPRGQALLMPRSIVDIITEHNVQNAEGQVDDYMFGAILCDYYAHRDESFLNHLYTVGLYSTIMPYTVEDVNSRIFSRYLFIQIKNYVCGSKYIPYGSDGDCYERRVTEPRKLERVDIQYRRNSLIQLNLRLDEDYYCTFAALVPGCWQFSEGFRYTKEELVSHSNVITGALLEL